MSNSSDKRPLPFHWFWWIVSAFCLILAYYFPPHQVAFKVGFVFLAIALVLLGVSILIRIQRYDADELARQREEEERRLAEAERQRKRVDFLPPLMAGCALAYKYTDVDCDLVPDLDLLSLAGCQLRLIPGEQDGAPVALYLRGRQIGTLAEDNRAAMVRDWSRRGDPFACAVTYVDAGLYHANLTLVFYRQELAAHPDAPVYRLTGVVSASAALCSAGDPCSLAYDNKSGRFAVILVSGQHLGFLPVSAALSVSAMGTGGSAVYVASSCMDGGQPVVDVAIII